MSLWSSCIPTCLNLKTPIAQLIISSLEKQHIDFLKNLRAIKVAVAKEDLLRVHSDGPILEYLVNVGVVSVTYQRKWTASDAEEYIYLDSVFNDHVGASHPNYVYASYFFYSKCKSEGLSSGLL